MKPLLIVKTGTTFPSLRDRFGDFEDYIAAQLPPSAGGRIVAPVFERRWLPAADEISGVVVTGSHAMVTDREAWSEYLAGWLRAIPTGSLPVLGICYGHQLLAHAFGGEVGYHPGGGEIGVADIRLTGEGRQDPLLGSLPASFQGYVAHEQTVLKLPAGAKLLAAGGFEPHQAFVIGGNMWGVQFHPEFTAAITRACIDEQRQELARAGRDVGRLRAAVGHNEYGGRLLTRFWQLAGG